MKKGLDVISRRMELLRFCLCICIGLKGMKNIKSFVFIEDVFIKKKREMFIWWKEFMLS